MVRGSHRMRHRSGRWIALAVIVASVIAGSVFLLRTNLTASEATTSLPLVTQPTSTDSPTGSDTPPQSLIEVPHPPTFPPSTSVLVIGDSLAVGIAEQVTAAMPGRQIVVEAAEGRNTATSVELVAGHAAYTPSIWVVSLGTNDNSEEFADNAKALMELAGRDRCVLWYDVYRPVEGDDINAILRGIQIAHSNMEILNWQDMALAHPEWFSSDGIHPSSEGYLQRSNLAARAVSQTCTDPGP